METFPALLALYVGNPPVTGRFTSQRPVTRSFDVFFDLRLNKRLIERPRCQWFETPSRSLLRHCNGKQLAFWRHQTIVWTNADWLPIGVFFRRMIQWNLNRYINIFTQEYACEIDRYKVQAIYFRPHRVHDDAIKWKQFPRNWPFVRGIQRSPVNSPHKGQWRGVLVFSLICVWINGWVNNREAGDLRRYRAHYDVIVMLILCIQGRILSIWIHLILPWISNHMPSNVWDEVIYPYPNFKFCTVEK